jgi:hypothetical protein
MPSKATRRVSKGFLLDEFTSLSPLLTLRVTFQRAANLRLLSSIAT